MSDRERRLEDLAEVHGPRVLGYLARRTDPADAADVFQAVLLTAWRRLGVVPDDEAAALAWLLATARRCLANERRGRARRLRATDRLVAEIRVRPGEPSATGPVDRALAGLESADRELLTLVYWEDLSIDQAATVLGISPEAARKRLQRARDRVRRTLESESTGPGSTAQAVAGGSPP